MAMRRLELPAQDEPWSVRRFWDRHEADAFYERLEKRLKAAYPSPPAYLGEPLLGPDGSILPAGSWIILYRPILGQNAGAA